MSLWDYGRTKPVQKLNDAFSRAVSTIYNPLREVGCVTAWALDYDHDSDPRAEILASAALARVPEEDQILIWLGAPNADISAVRAAAAPLLDPEEEVAAMRLHDAADQCASLAAHAGARIMLGAAIGVSPSRVRIRRGEYGKPLLDGGILHFSLAHVRGAVAIALARRPVGIDIERKVVLPDINAIAATAFARESCKALDAAEGEARTEMFYRFWTLGEAFIKATGLGVFQGLDSFAFTPDGQPGLTRVTPGWGARERWRFGLW
jgi:4'-phosphopantetheinyl transferase